MKIVVNRVENQKDLNNGRYNFYVDEKGLVEFSDNIKKQTKDKLITISYGGMDSNKIIIEKISERVR